MAAATLAMVIYQLQKREEEILTGKRDSKLPGSVTRQQISDLVEKIRTHIRYEKLSSDDQKKWDLVETEVDRRDAERREKGLLGPEVGMEYEFLRQKDEVELLGILNHSCLFNKTIWYAEHSGMRCLIDCPKCWAKEVDVAYYFSSPSIKPEPPMKDWLRAHLLGLHLIGKHGVWDGCGNKKYTVDQAAFFKLFNVRSGVDYKPKMATDAAGTSLPTESELSSPL